MKCQKHILGIRWHDHIRNTEITEHTGLPPLMDQIITRRNSFFGHVAGLGNDTPAHQAPGARSTSLLDGFPIVLGSILLVAQEASGWIRFALITILLPAGNRCQSQQLALLHGRRAFGESTAWLMAIQVGHYA